MHQRLATSSQWTRHGGGGRGAALLRVPEQPLGPHFYLGSLACHHVPGSSLSPCAGAAQPLLSLPPAPTPKAVTPPGPEPRPSKLISAQRLPTGVATQPITPNIPHSTPSAFSIATGIVSPIWPPEHAPMGRARTGSQDFNSGPRGSLCNCSTLSGWEPIMQRGAPKSSRLDPAPVLPEDRCHVTLGKAPSSPSTTTDCQQE